MSSAVRFLRDRWNQYWFGGGGRYSLAIVRIAVAVAVWRSLSSLQATWPINAVHGGADAASAYHAHGVWRLAGSSAPPIVVVHTLWTIAKVSTIAMALGAGGRIASATSWLAGSSLAALYYSGFVSWSHEFNVVFTAQLAIAFARTTDALSVDALVRRLRGRPPHNDPGAYQWATRLAQLACALMFASAAYHKLTSDGGLSLRWALSDNLRNQLLVHFDVAGTPRTAVASWLLESPWRYRAAAVGNLFAQSMPLVACFLVRRPILRAICGMAFVGETVALGYVMALWNMPWLPLAAVFIDWDALLRQPSPSPAPRALGTRIFVVVFVVVAAVTSLTSRVRLYPFSTFPMFSGIRAREPYSQHLPYSFARAHIELVAPDRVPPDLEQELDRFYSKNLRLHDRAKLLGALDAILVRAQQVHPGTTGLRVYDAIVETTAYPAPAAVAVRPVALLAIVDAAGIHSLLGTAHVAAVTVTLTPSEPVRADRIEVYAQDRAEPSAVFSMGWTIPRVVDKAVYVAVVGGERWVVAN